MTDTRTPDLKDPTLLREAALVGDKWIDAAGQGVAVHNPATGDLIGHVPN